MAQLPPTSAVLTGEMYGSTEKNQDLTSIYYHKFPFRFVLL